MEKPDMGASESPTDLLAQPEARSKSEPRALSQAPLVLERYRLQRRLGAGAFGTVWLARDERLDREVAIKIVPRARIVGGRFEREARAAARLAHPGIVTLYEAGVDRDDAYLVSELVRGSTLDELLSGGHVSDRHVVAIGIALCDALDHAHAQGVIHRDVKPSNVLVPNQPVTPAHAARLTDFGVARVIGGDSLTRTGDVVGTAAYMSPEQAEGLVAGPTADLYSLALVLYEALTGINPVRTGTAAQRARRLGAHLPPLRRQRRDLPRELGGALDLALRPRPRERGSVAELREALASVLERVDDRPGVVASPWPVRAIGQEPFAREPRPEPDPDRRDRTDPDRRDRTNPDERDRPEADLDRIREAWPARAAAAAGTAALAVWISSRLLTTLAIPAPVVALIAAGLTLVLPRLGWLALTAGLVASLALENHAGAALVVALAAMVPVALLPRSPSMWPLAAVAPVLGVASLAGAWPAIAAWAGGARRRAAVASTGWIWLVVAQLLTGTHLYTRAPPGVVGPRTWVDSPYDTLHHALVPVASSGLLAPALVWAGAAILLPYLLRGRLLSANLILVTMWAATVASAVPSSIALVHGAHGLIAPGVAVIGALASATVALAPTTIRHWRSAL